MVYVIDVSQVYGKGKVTIPKYVRSILGVEDGDRIVWVAREDGSICVMKAPKPPAASQQLE